MEAGREESVKNKGLLVRLVSTKQPLFCFSLGKKKLPLSSNADNSKHNRNLLLIKAQGKLCLQKWRSFCKALHMLIETFFFFFLSFSEKGGAGSWVCIGKHVSKIPLWEQQLGAVHQHRETFCTPSFILTDRFTLSPNLSCASVNHCKKGKFHDVENEFGIFNSVTFS